MTMGPFLILLVVAAVFIGVESSSTLKCSRLADCASGWEQFGSNFYCYEPKKKIFSVAESDCVAKGGNLASVHSSQENDFIKKLIKDKGDNTAWIGGSDEATEGTWTWTDGTPFDFKDWSGVEPNDSGGVEDCLFMYKENGYTWYDAKCVDDYTWIIASVCKV